MTPRVTVAPAIARTLAHAIAWTVARTLASSVAVAAIAAAALPTPVRAQQPTVITQGAQYQGGQRLSAPFVGVDLTLPEGFVGAWSPEAVALVAQSQTGVFGAVWGYSEGSVEELASAIGERLSELGIQLQPRGEVQLDAQEMRGFFEASTPQGAALLYAVVRLGQAGNPVAVAAMGQPTAESDLTGFVDAVVGSFAFTVPGAASWRVQVQGTVLDWQAGGSDMSTGATTATGASSSTARLALCGGSQYGYQESSETYVSIEGMSASSESSDSHQGQWWLIADLVGEATLVLESTDGRYFEWPVVEEGNGFLIDGSTYVVSGSCE